MKRLGAITSLGLVGLLTLSGCKNDNLFGGLHKEGSGDAASLLADGQAALARGDYADAEAYFRSSLAQNPSSAQALYGAAVATMGNSGLDIGQLVSNLTTQGTPGGAPAFSQALAGASVGAPGAPSGTSILEQLDVAKLDAAVEKSLCYLERIRQGYSDGTISRSNANLLINLGLLHLIRAATQIAGLGEIRKSFDQQEFEYAPTATPPFNPGQCAVILSSFQNAAWGYQGLTQAAVLVLGQKAGDTLFDLKGDVRNLFADFKDAVATATGCGLELDTLDDNPDLVPGPTNPGDCL